MNEISLPSYICTRLSCHGVCLLFLLMFRTKGRIRETKVIGDKDKEIKTKMNTKL